MIHLQELIQYLDSLLEPTRFSDYCTNGLQVEGRHRLQTLVTGVSANQAFFEAAIEKNADAVLVHHGFFWKNEAPNIIGIKQKRLAALIRNDINLLAYHLPLDVHPEFGNNVQLAKQLGMIVTGRLDVDKNLPLVFLGKFDSPQDPDSFSKRLEEKLLRKPFAIISSNPKPIETIAWCTGAAQDFIEIAAKQKVDAYLTGEVSERTVHLAKELNVHFFAAGHHATERYGVQALGQHLAKKFEIDHHFIDIENPI